MSVKETCLALMDEGFSNADISEAVGVSHQYVARICGRNPNRKFKPITEKQCVYPAWRKWLNDNKVTRTRFLRLMGNNSVGENYKKLTSWMEGDCNPTKKTIDNILRVTGLTYEQLFYREDDSCG